MTIIEGEQQDGRTGDNGVRHSGPYFELVRLFPS